MTNQRFPGAYHDLRNRLIDVVVNAADDELERTTPAAPEWRVRDVVAHLTGVTSDILSGNLEGVGTDSWTEAHVAARRDRSISDIVDEWRRNGERVDSMIDDFPPDPVQQLITDSATHEHDIRGALGSRDERESDAVVIAFNWMLGFVGAARAAHDAGALAVETGEGSRVVGEGDATATLRADRFELFRSMTGRRSLDQIRAYDWSGDARPELLAVGIFRPRATALRE